MRISVIIPTTDGPAQVLRLEPLQNAPRSVMRTQDDYHPLPVSSSYHAFTERGGPLDIALGLGGCAFDLRLSSRIDTGRSWELPVALAHWLRANGREVCADVPDLVIWATGALDLDMEVIAQDYHLDRKVSASMAELCLLIENRARVILLFPAGAPLPKDLPEGSQAKDVAAFSEAVRVLGPLISAEAALSKMPPDKARLHDSFSKPWIMAAMSAFTFVALVIGGSQKWQDLAEVAGPDDRMSGLQQEVSDETELTNPLTVVDLISTPALSETEVSEVQEPDSGADIDVDKGSPELPKLILLRAPEGTSCINVHFGVAVPERVSLRPDQTNIGDTGIGDLCAVGLSLPNSASAAITAKASDMLLRHVTRSERRAEFTLEPGDEHVFRLTSELPDRFDLHWQIEGLQRETNEITFSFEVNK